MMLIQLLSGMDLAEKGLFLGPSFSWICSDKSLHEHYFTYHVRVVRKPTRWLFSTLTTAVHFSIYMELDRSLGGCSSQEGQQGFPKPTDSSTDGETAASLQGTNTFLAPTYRSRAIHVRARASGRLRMSQKNSKGGGFGLQHAPFKKHQSN